MYLQFYLLLMLSHILSDFVFQGNLIKELRFATNFNEKKSKKLILISIKKSLKGNLLHVGIHAITTIILLFLVSWFQSYENTKTLLNSFSHEELIRIIGFVLLIHFIIDMGKSLCISYYPSMQKNIFMFLVDQFLHILSITFFLHPLFMSYIVQSFAQNTMISGLQNMSTINKLLLSMILILIVTVVTGIFIKIFMDHMDEKNRFKTKINQSDITITQKSVNGEIKKGGFIIGILERLIILLAMITSQPVMIGFLLTAKSIARLKKLGEDKFAEYFLIGNSLSFFSAILIGLLFQILIIS